METVVSFSKPKLWQIPNISDATNRSLSEKSAALEKRLRFILSQHQKVKLASSLAVEDMVITDMLVNIAADAEVFTLETGRLNPETLSLIDILAEHYPMLKFKLYKPDAKAVEAYTSNKGLNAFYESVDLRKECCRIRKVEPLNRALADAGAWLTGQRREQSVTRTELAFAEQDTARGIAKYNPIYDWSEEDVWAYIRCHSVPYNSLYEQGYPSIGCEPCTRPIRAGEEIRAGRWWWESKDSKECGLHK
ncbi:MAG: phosphoadenylyl-sulfate reductase [Neisseria sp.]|uniref:phosphoadenylyl-sulfate reductase n=1 Tax=Neisseria sp. TaxID=192066 RepID=UPI0026DC758B|nr:phosphoadenylyl-sulfate reductase [Neisseria sp.]MDO4640189.1 phosphoadenylyl-sulfate reductase [Neisseria sp.]